MRLTFTTALIVTPILLLLSAPRPGSAAPSCDDVLSRSETPPAAARSDSLRVACRAGMKCTSRCGDKDERYTAIGSFDGGFVCQGKRERVVSLFPCGGGMGMRGAQGVIVLLQATARGWRAAGEFSGSYLVPEQCSVESVGERDIVVCRSLWGPYQGVVGTSVCVVHGSGGSLKKTCPIRVSSSGDREPPNIGEVRVLPGRQSDQVLLAVEIGGRQILLELDKRGVRPSAKTKTEFKKAPMDDVELSNE